MCGLSGGFSGEQAGAARGAAVADLERLFLLSQLRGQDAAGVALAASDGMKIIRRPGSIRQLLADPRYRAVLKEWKESNNPELIFLAQSRLSTNGPADLDENNQPFNADTLIGIHNGIVTEFGPKLPHRFVNEAGAGENDSRLLMLNLRDCFASTGDIARACVEVFSQIRGAASVALWLPERRKFVLATNTGSLYYLFSSAQNVFYFSSERLFLERFRRRAATLKGARAEEIRQVPVGTGLILGPGDRGPAEFSLGQRPVFRPAAASGVAATATAQASVRRLTIRKLPDVSGLRRCQKCVLPETYPFIEFDQEGVCNFCRRYDRQKVHGKEELLRVLERYRSKDGSPDCLVGLSGGRDSCYGLHLLKKELGMNPVTYTFDWGLTTDTSRRNQSRFCAELGVEHVLRSAELAKKRAFVQKNVEAFLKHPHLGMVPLFMAGDKEFYQLGRTLRRELRLPVTVMCGGHSLEQRDFMTGFCGVDENIAGNKPFFQFSLLSKIRLALFYSLQYARNPAYINASLVDSVKSFFYSFIYRDDFLYLFEYWQWNEQEIETVLAEQYGWESDRSYGRNQWRMGDGQTAFTNYIYLAVAGFSEFDNFRSNQIREGMLTRDEALRLIREDNQPKTEMLRYFAEVVGLDLEPALKRIDAIPRLY